MNPITVTEQTLGGRKVKVGTSPVWEGVLEWLKTGKVPLVVQQYTQAHSLPSFEPMNHSLSEDENICVLPTKQGILLYLPADLDKMAVKVTVVDGKEKKLPNYDGTDLGLAKKSGGGRTMCHQMSWNSQSLMTLVAIIPKILLEIEDLFQGWDGATNEGMRTAKSLMTRYIDVNLNFLPRMCQFGVACIYLSGTFNVFEHSMLRYINGQFTAFELIRNRRADGMDIRDRLKMLKNGANPDIEVVLYHLKLTPSGHTVISQLGDDFTMATEVKQGCALKLMGNRAGKISVGDVDLDAFTASVSLGKKPNPVPHSTIGPVGASRHVQGEQPRFTVPK
ncbi:non-structural protein NSP9 [Raspberry latent virus]|uniref:non-structural protein NSP9 n=1 Tax=Raspberry latent virus TaxID=907191 RepID=UPI0001E69020|nr:non-structural protein NSP9 [Raspberry latent virus]ADO27695.1 non-structural protein NSP9 [Raspberry latent virus]